MLSNAWKDYEYTQIVGDVNALSVGTSMMIIRKIKKLENPTFGVE